MLLVLQTGDAKVFDLDLSGDSKILITVGHNDSVKVWECAWPELLEGYLMIFRMPLYTAMLRALLLLSVAVVPTRAEDQPFKAGLKFTSAEESLSHYEQQIKPVFLKTAPSAITRKRPRAS